MQEDIPSGLINLPSVDLTSYVKMAISFVVENYPTLLIVIRNIISFLITISIPLSIFLFVAIIITVERLKAIRNKESEIYDAKADMGYSDVVPDPKKGNPEMAKKWDNVLNLVESANPSDWRQAVLEADIILGDLLTTLGYKGEGIGEQLRRATKADFKTLDDAWGAHKVRNEIAHAGSDYPFSQYDARETISKYRRVFEEFFHI